MNTTAAHRPATRVILVSLALAARAWTLDAGAGQAPSLADVTGAVSVEGRARRDAVVWIQGPAAPETAPAAVVLDQGNLAFAPRMLAVRVGTRVEMPNNDRVFHNVFSFKDGKRFDLGRYTVGARVPIAGRLAASVGVAHQTGHLTQRRATAVEAGQTGSWRKAL